MTVDVSSVHPNILLIDDSAENVRSVQGAMSAIRFDCSLRTIGAGIGTMAYLRRKCPYADAPDPDLILFDLSDPQSRYFKLLDAIRADEKLASKPIVILTNDAAQEKLAAKYGSRQDSTMFSPLELDKFLGTMKSLEPKRFLGAVQQLEKFGLVQVRLPN